MLGRQGSQMITFLLSYLPHEHSWAHTPDTAGEYVAHTIEQMIMNAMHLTLAENHNDYMHAPLDHIIHMQMVILKPAI